jgi:hypothetical protein
MAHAILRSTQISTPINETRIGAARHSFILTRYKAKRQKAKGGEGRVGEARVLS